MNRIHNKALHTNMNSARGFHIGEIKRYTKKVIGVMQCNFNIRY
jgi:hypothetical protein